MMLTLEIENWQQLEQDLRTQVLTQPAELIETTPYGEKYSALRCNCRGGLYPNLVD